VNQTTQSGLTIRTPTADDAARLAALSTELGYPADPERIRTRLLRLLDRPDQCLRLAASPAGETIGWIHAHEQCVLEADPWCEIVGLVVDPQHRSQGAGRALVDQVERWARARGLRVLKVRSNVVRPESHPFYQRLGFDRIKTQHVYRKALG
jgi:GNAT superfamily N-acetyltransferase